MKRIVRLSSFILPLLAAGALAGCASSPHADRDAGMASGKGMSCDGCGEKMSMQQMCDMYRQTAAEKSPEERQKMMDQMMPGMSPDMQQMHMRMMQDQCR
ncbi:MAG: hypothetical protein ACTHL1_12325 [Burkholderiaceae bacterium]